MSCIFNASTQAKRMPGIHSQRGLNNVHILVKHTAVTRRLHVREYVCSVTCCSHVRAWRKVGGLDFSGQTRRMFVRLAAFRLVACCVRCLVVAKSTPSHRCRRTSINLRITQISRSSILCSEKAICTNSCPIHRTEHDVLNLCTLIFALDGNYR